MRRFTLLAIAALAALSPLSGQEAILPTPPDQIETILELLDAVDAAQIAVLNSTEAISETDIEDLYQLVAVAETIGAQDLAARARTLIVLASFGELASPDLPSVDGGLEPGGSLPLARDTETFRRWVNVGATAGATALELVATTNVNAQELNGFVR